MSALTAEMKSLPLSDRIQLAQDLWDSVAAETPLQLTAAQRNELDSRFAQHVQNPQTSLSWERVKAKLMGPAH